MAKADYLLSQNAGDSESSLSFMHGIPMLCVFVLSSSVFWFPRRSTESAAICLALPRESAIRRVGSRLA